MLSSVADGIREYRCHDHSRRQNQDLDHVCLIVPTYNAGEMFDRWLVALKSQTRLPGHVLVVDSGSTDGTVERAVNARLTVRSIKQRTFNHGRTRQRALQSYPWTEVVVFLTQDAILGDSTAIERLLAAFSDEQVGLVYGRQLPRPEADPIEAHARLFNYPPVSQARTPDDISRLGIKATFASNSFAAWRRRALDDIGGFPHDVIQNEDTWAAAKLLQAGWKTVYCAEAKVYHSHHLTWKSEFSRYFDIGVFHARNRWIGESFGPARGEGWRFVRSELEFLSHTRPSLIASALMRTGLKYLGYKLGCCEKHLPLRFKRTISANKQHWTEGRR